MFKVWKTHVILRHVLLASARQNLTKQHVFSWLNTTGLFENTGNFVRYTMTFTTLFYNIYSKFKAWKLENLFHVGFEQVFQVIGLRPEVMLHYPSPNLVKIGEKMTNLQLFQTFFVLILYCLLAKNDQKKSRGLSTLVQNDKKQLFVALRINWSVGHCCKIHIHQKIKTGSTDHIW